MKITTYSTFMFAFCLAMFLSSCTESDPISNSFEVSEQEQAEYYMNTHNTPAIMFSYNIYDNSEKEMISYLIDNEGNVKTITQEKFSARENLSIPQSDLELLKQNATLVEGFKIDVEELVNNFNLLRTADRLEFNNNVQESKPQIHTSAYGFYYSGTFSANATGSSSTTNECGGGGSSSSSGSSYRGTSTSFASVLLEQTVDFDLVQTNDKGKWLVDWMNDLASQLVTTSDEGSN